MTYKDCGKTGTDKGVKRICCLQIYKYGSPGSAVSTPVTGQYLVELMRGDVVEVVIQNLKNNDSSEPLQQLPSSSCEATESGS
jgi:hypothetical protein